ncbi:MAG: DUF3575 domain-containing protein, partial [Bacteroidales bacterium]|nr:DUF3575 domain-containing protein [Bacteroidales bacterium]
ARKAEREAAEQARRQAAAERQANRQMSAAAADSAGVALFGLSTNTLLDAVAAVNIGAEVPVGHNWSVRAEYTTPWWSTANHSHALQVQNVNIGARYYIKPWTYRSSDVLRGWFVSANAGAGLYDVCWDYRGSRGRGILGNIGGGYSFALGDWWRLDLSAGIGMMIAGYERYQVSEDGKTVVPMHSGTARIPDPTSLKVSFVYLFHTRGKK